MLSCFCNCLFSWINGANSILLHFIYWWYIRQVWKREKQNIAEPPKWFLVCFCTLWLCSFDLRPFCLRWKVSVSAISIGSWWLSSSTLSHQSTNFLTEKYVLLHVKPSFDSWCEERQEMGQRDQGNNTHQMAEAARIWTCSGHKDPDPTTGSPFLKFVFLLNEITQCDYNETCFSKVCPFASLRCSFFSKIFSLL